MQAIVVVTTVGTEEQAYLIARELVGRRQAACVNIFPGMISIYEWKGAREVADEVAMIVKTRASLAEAVLAEAKRLHPYELPALIVLPAQGGSAEYCGWIAAQTQAP